MNRPIPTPQPTPVAKKAILAALETSGQSTTEKTAAKTRNIAAIGRNVFRRAMSDFLPFKGWRIHTAIHFRVPVEDCAQRRLSCRFMASRSESGGTNRPAVLVRPIAVSNVGFVIAKNPEFITSVKMNTTIEVTSAARPMNARLRKLFSKVIASRSPTAQSGVARYHLQNNRCSGFTMVQNVRFYLDFLYPIGLPSCCQLS
jgi:hypothetical protein